MWQLRLLSAGGERNSDTGTVNLAIYENWGAIFENRTSSHKNLHSLFHLFSPSYAMPLQVCETSSSYSKYFLWSTVTRQIYSNTLPKYNFQVPVLYLGIYILCNFISLNLTTIPRSILYILLFYI